MYSVEEIIKYNINVPYPRWLKGMDLKACFATNIGWILLKSDGKKESVMMIKNLDSRIGDYVKNYNIIIQKTNLDLEFEKEFNSDSRVENKNDEVENKYEESIKEETIKSKNSQISDVSFDFIELENEIENKFLRKNNLIRIYLTWTDIVNIRSFDKKRTYIEVFDNKHHKLGNAEYRSRETEKTLMFVYKIGKEKLNEIIVNSQLFDGNVKDNNNVLIENVNKEYKFDVNVNIEKE